MRLRRLPVLAVGFALLATPAAQASSSQESIFQDDPLIVFATPSQLARNLDTLRGLGVDRIRVSVFWNLVAPSPTSASRPRFNAGDPAAYPADSWTRYDQIVEMAAQRGIGVYFNFSPAVPRWAAQAAPNSNFEGHYRPSGAEFQQFAQAVGIRYSGRYVPPSPTAAASAPAPTTSSPQPGNGITLPVGVSAARESRTRASARSALAPGAALPRVSYWSIWNEPNEYHFLAPQWDTAGGRVIEPAAALYRSLVDGGFAGLAASGHGGDTILIGETAPKGKPFPGQTNSIKPLRFLRALYCLSTSLQPLRGGAAAALGCPTSDQRRRFPAAHPGLFRATGWAHHPYSLVTPPTLRSGERDDLGFADLPKLTATLRKVFRRYGVPRSGLPIYLTEFGYQTNPPDPFGFRPALQAHFLNQSEFLAYRNRQVRSYAQFLLIDDGPNTSFPRSSPLYWSTFQTGLIARNGTVKPGFVAYRLPLFMPATSHRGPGRLRVWGELRPAPNFIAALASVQLRPARGGAFRSIASLRTTNGHNYVDARVRFSRSGTVRLAWRDASGTTLYSRPVAVTIR